MPDMNITRRALLQASVAGVAIQSMAAQRTPPRLNLIVIVIDTLGTEWLGCYGNGDIQTPHIDALSRRSVTFLDSYAENLPTIPARRSLYTGRQTFPSLHVAQPGDPVSVRGWHQLFADDVTMAETLTLEGYNTGLISDVYHQFKPGKNFHRGFGSWHWIRGQESDPLEIGEPSSVKLTDHLHPTQLVRGQMWTPRTGIFQYLLNRRSWKTESDYFPAQVFDRASQWLEKASGMNTPLYLHIESFAPHEYWDPPESYYRRYFRGDYRGPKLIYPPRTTINMSPIEIQHARALYYGYVTFVDDCIGRFLNRVDRLGLADNTIVTLVGDHGTLMGEQNQMHKGEKRLRRQVTRVPLLLHHPAEKWADRRVSGFVQHTDLVPTMLDLLRVKPPPRVTGRTLRRAIASGDTGPDSIVIGWGNTASVRTPEWNYIGAWNGDPGDQLYDLKRDRDELRNIAEEHPKLVAEFRQRVKLHVAESWATTTKGTFASVAD